jgi:hypothetical protein
MKNVLKFLAIFVSSLLLAVVFGYWFGRLELFLSGNKLTGSVLFSTVNTRLSTIIEGFPWAYLLFLTLLTTVIVKTTKHRIVFLLVGALPMLLFLAYVSVMQIFWALLMVALGFLLGELILFAKRKFKKA